jgi:hypothetical protein
VTRALHTGLELGLEELHARAETAFAATDAERERLLAEAGKLLEELGRHGDEPHPAPGAAVARLLPVQARPETA